MKTLRIYPFSTFPIYHTAVLIIVILYVISLVLIYHISGSLYLLMISNSFFPPPSTAGYHKSNLLFCEFGFCFVLFQESTCKWDRNNICLSVWLISLGIMPTKSIHVVANSRISSLCMAEYYYIVYIQWSFCIYSSIGKHLGCLHVLATVNNAVWAWKCRCIS